MRPRPHLSARRAGVVALVLAAAFGLGGCQPEPTAASPSPTAGATPAATATPSPTPTDASPGTVLFDGDCAALLRPSDAPAELGEITVTEGSGGTIAVATLGGISCSYDGDSVVLVTAFPRSVVADDIVERYREPVCEGFGYDGYGCRVGRESGGVWSLTTLGPSQWGDDLQPTPLLDATADAVAANAAAAPAAAPAERTTAWWSTTCSALGTELDLAAILGVDDVEEGYPADRGSDVDIEVALRAGSFLGYCAWYGFAGTELRAIQVWPYPGGGWAWDRSAEGLAEIETLPVSGATQARIGMDAAEMPMADMTDGVNLVRVAVGEFDASIPATLAAVMAALSD